MKVNVKAGSERYTIEFSVSPGGRSTGVDLIAMAKTSKDLDKVQDYISKAGGSDSTIGVLISKQIEKQLKLPIDVDYAYDGAGFGFKFDMYSIAKSLK